MTVATERALEGSSVEGALTLAAVERRVVVA